MRPLLSHDKKHDHRVHVGVQKRAYCMRDLGLGLGLGPGSESWSMEHGVWSMEYVSSYGLWIMLAAGADLLVVLLQILCTQHAKKAVHVSNALHHPGDLGRERARVRWFVLTGVRVRVRRES